MKGRERDRPTPATPSSLSRATPALIAALAAMGVALLASPAATAAQEQEAGIDSPYRWIPLGVRVGVFGGHVNADRGDARLGPGSTPIAGGRFRGRISSPISLEVSAGYGNSDRLLIDPTLPEGPAPVDTLSTQWILTEAALQLALTGRRTWNRLQPYIVVGAGLLTGISEEGGERFASADSADFRYEINVAPVAQVGLGTEVLVSDRIGIGLEVRDHLWRVKTPEGFFRSEVLETIESLDLPAPPDTQWTHNLELSLTLWRYF